MRLCVPVLLVLLFSPSHAQTIHALQGEVEVQREGWTLLQQPGPLREHLRSLLGRVDLRSGGGKILLGSHSRVQPLQGKVQVLEGQAYAEGQLTFFMGLHQLLLQGKARTDHTAFENRVAVLEGTLQVSGVPQGKVTLQAGQQYNFKTRRVEAFQEQNPWYLNTWLGLGQVQVTALRGLLERQRNGSWQKLKVKDLLEVKDLVRSGAGSWAEFTFQDGTYFRLNEQSELQVLGIEKLSDGKRQITLQLNKGTLWNVVQKGKGGYQLRTATLVAGVRGTTFRLDATDTLKLFEGEVQASTSEALLDVAAGWQYTPSSGMGNLQPDATDRFNQDLDLLNGQPLTLQLMPVPAGPVQHFTVQGHTMPGAEVQLDSAAGTWTAEVQSDGRFVLPADFPEGRTTYTVRALRNNREYALAQTLVLDRTPPSISQLETTWNAGLLEVQLKVQDQSKVQVQVLDQTFGYSGAVLHLPVPAGVQSLTLVLQDQAGNTLRREVPLPPR